MLLFPPGADYAIAFLACLYAGVIAVPAYLPRGDRQLPRLAAILADATPRVALTTSLTLSRGGVTLGQRDVFFIAANDGGVVHIQLNAVGAERDRPAEARQGVFHALPGRPAMPDPLDPLKARHGIY